MGFTRYYSFVGILNEKKWAQYTRWVHLLIKDGIEKKVLADKYICDQNMVSFASNTSDVHHKGPPTPFRLQRIVTAEGSCETNRMPYDPYVAVAMCLARKAFGNKFIITDDDVKEKENPSNYLMEKHAADMKMIVSKRSGPKTKTKNKILAEAAKAVNFEPIMQQQQKKRKRMAVPAEPFLPSAVPTETAVPQHADPAPAPKKAKKKKQPKTVHDLKFEFMRSNSALPEKVHCYMCKKRTHCANCSCDERVCKNCVKFVSDGIIGYCMNCYPYDMKMCCYACKGKYLPTCGQKVFYKSLEQHQKVHNDANYNFDTENFIV
jgi:hypothetical protein